MGITNMYPNLPGHLVEFKDGGLQLTSMPDDTTGFKKSLLILGTALDGPINEPVKIDEKTVTQLFGPEVNDKNYPNGATLTKYAKQAFAHGFSDVRCMRVTGTEASVPVPVSTNSETTEVSHTVTGNRIDGHPETLLQLDSGLLPITKDTDVGELKLCTMAPTPGTHTPNGVVAISSLQYSFGDGKVVLPANCVSKNASVWAVFNQQKIYGKGGVSDVANKTTCHFITDIVGADGNPSDTATTPIDASGYDPSTDPDITFKLKLGTGEKLYSQVFNGSDVDRADAYPAMYTAIVAAEASTTLPAKPTTTATDGSGATIVDAVAVENDAIARSKGLKVIIIGEYQPTGMAPQHHVLSKDDFTVDEATGVVTITAPTISVTYDKDSDTSTPDVTEDLAYTSYKVQYLVYTNVHAEQEINLKTLTGGTPATNDVIDLGDAKKALSASIKVTGNDVEIPAGKYTVDTSGTNTAIVLPAGNVSMGTVVKVEYKTEERTVAEKQVVFKSIYGGEVYNDSVIKFEKVTETKADGTSESYIKVTFCKPQSKYYSKSEVPFYYKSCDVPTVGQLRDFLKNYELNNVFAIEADDEDITLEELYDAVCRLTAGSAGSSVTSAEIKLANGDNGLNPTDEQLFVALSGERDAQGYLISRGAYQVLENYHCDYIYPAGAKADKLVTVNGRKQSFQYELALACAVLTYRTKMTHGFIDVSPNSNTSLVGVQKHVDKLLQNPNLHYMQDREGKEILDSNNERMDIGWYTSVVVGPDPVMISDSLGTYYGSAAIAYAALVASLKPQSSPMNKPLPNVKGMKYKFSNKQMDALIGNRMVCFRLKNEGSTTATSVPYCVDAMTSGAPKCDYSRMTTVSIVTDVIDQIREVADPFIGEPNTIEQRNALSALISKRLSYIYESGEITYYSFEINATIQQVLLGECTISLTLICPMELRKITTVVSLRAAA